MNDNVNHLVNTSEKEYGCTVCIHCDKCEPNPFGVCSKFKREEEK